MINKYIKRKWIRYIISKSSKISIENSRGVLYAVSKNHKSAHIAGLLTSPLVDSLIESENQSEYVYITFGILSGAEYIKSVQIPLDITYTDFIYSQFLAGPVSIEDINFISELYKAKDLLYPKRIHIIHVARTYLLQRYFSYKFRDLARKCKSARVLVYYNATMLGVIHAFRSRNKEVWDIQHGNISIANSGYNNTKAFNFNTKLKPTGFYVWSEYFGLYLSKTFQCQWKNTNFAHLRYLAGESKINKKQKFKIIYSLQWGLDIPDYLFKLVSIYSNIQWCLRVHPNEKKYNSRLERLANMKNVQVPSSQEPLANLLLDAHVHITFNSSVVHEAASLNLPSIFLDVDSIERFGCEISNGMAIFSRVEQLEEKIDDFLKNSNFGE